MTETQRMDNPRVRHERSDVSNRAVLLWGVSLVAIITVVGLGSWLLFDHLQDRQQRIQPPPLPLAVEERQKQERLDPAGPQTPSNWSNSRGLPPLPRSPRLEGIEGQTRSTQTAKPHPVSNSYRWVDPKESMLQIPLEEAMRLVVDRYGKTPPSTRSGARPEEKFPAVPSRASSGRSSIGREP